MAKQKGAILKFFKSNWTLILAVLYLLLPFDFLPEFLLGPLGLTDDAFLIVLEMIRRIIISKKSTEGKTETAPEIQD
jgi:uncharacterized membrane protein YkvA (DUF1232 family)